MEELGNAKRMAKSYKLTKTALYIDDVEVPWWLYEEGPRIEDIGDRHMEVLWVPVLVATPRFMRGKPGGKPAKVSES